MPRGKISPRMGGVGWVSHYPMSTIAWEMLRRRKKGCVPLGPDVIKKHSGTLRAAFREYQIKRKGAVTATSRKRVRHLISSRASKVLEVPESENWRTKLLEALSCRLEKHSWGHAADGQYKPIRDKQFRIELHLLLGAHREDAPPTAQLKDLERALDCSIPFTPSEVESLKLFADLPNHLSVNSGKWRDPALVTLVLAIGPVWQEVTGRSLKHTSVDAIASGKHSHFAKWLGATFSKLGLPPPPQKRVTDIVKSLEI